MVNGRRVRMLVPEGDVSDFHKAFPRHGVWEEGPYGRDFVVYLPAESAQQNTEYFSQGLKNYRAQRQKAPTHSPRIVAQTAAQAAAQQIPQVYQQPAQPSYPPYYPQYPYQQSPPASQPSQEKMSRRKFLGLCAAGVATVAVAAVGLGFLFSSKVTPPAESKEYEGNVLSKFVSDSNGKLTYYADVCHTVDEGNITASV